MSILAIRRAFEQKLLDIVPTIETALEKQKFTPTTDVPYQRAFVLLGRPENPTLNDGHFREIGILQVTLCYPLGEGSLDIEERAQLIRDTFTRGTTLTNGGITVVINRTPAISSGGAEEDRELMFIKMPFHAEIFS